MDPNAAPPTSASAPSTASAPVTLPNQAAPVGTPPAPSDSGQSQNLLQKFKNNRKLVLILSLVGFLLVAAVAGALLLQNNQPKPVETAKEKVSNEPVVKTYPGPKAEFASYGIPATNPLLPTTAALYTLKTTFSDQDAYSLGSKLGMTDYKKTNTSYIIGHNSTQANKVGMLSFDMNTGTFSFQSYGIVKPTSTQSKLPQTVALSMLTELGVADTTVSCPITYERTDFEGITYVECHRDWQKTGLPIYNIAGLLNIPITTKLSSLIIGSVSSTSPVDLPVTNVSTGAGANGKARPNDFNTATVGVLADGSIASIVSNIRVIDKTDPLIQADFISPTEAFEKIKTNSSDVFLTLPQGSGVVDWATIYKDNKAIADTATVTEYVLSYLEKPAADQQTYLTPMYTVRGEAKLTTGYTVSFVATVPALKDNTSFIATQTKTDLLNLFSAVPKAYAQTPKKNLQLETLTPPISQTTPVVPTSEPEVPVATPTSAPAPTGAPPGGGTECPNPAHGQNVILDIAGLGKMTVVLGAPNTYYFKSSTFPLADMNQVRDAFFLAVAEEYTVNVAQYMQQNNIKTVSDPKALFKQINGKECDDPTKGVAKAPLFNCPETRGTQFRGEFANRVADDVAAKITSIAGGDQIAEYAQKPSIFPSASLQVLFVFPAAEETGFGFGCQISGVSPALFLYPKTQTNVRVSLPSFTTYTNPSATNNIWNVTASPSGSITSSQSASILTHLYYEYNPANVSLQHPQNGYVVKYDNWTKVVSEVALTAKLNTNETQRLRLDVQNELSKHPKSNYIRLSVLTQSTLNTHLPITISPQPNLFYRLHILISPLSKQTAVKKPMIVSLFRTGFTAVEVGAHYK